MSAPSVILCVYTFPLPSFFSSPDSQYLTCRMQNCTEANRNKPFPGYIDPDSLIVQDDYVFVQVWTIHFCWLSQMFLLPASVPNAAFYACLHSLEGKKKKRKEKKIIIFLTKGTLRSVKASADRILICPLSSVWRTYQHVVMEALLRV